MKFIKYCALAAGALFLFLALFYISGKRVPVLIYHHLLEDSENNSYRNSSVITPEKFEEQMSWLHNNGYETVTLDELFDFIVNKKALPGKRVMLTFDDGYLSNYKYAYPILEKYGYTAVNFAITGEINETPQPFNPDKLVFLSIPEMEEMGGVFEFGSHTNRMHSMTEDETPFIIYHDDEAVKADLAESFSLPHVEKYFSYPFGYFKKSNIKTLKDLDVKLAFTIGRGSATRHSNRYKVPRRIIRGDITMDEFIRIVR